MPSLSRRRFLHNAALISLASGMTSSASRGRGLASAADGRPAVNNPRATSGDGRHQPDWSERLTITVGPKKADIVGGTDRAVQAAVDYVARFGGGTVHVLPGTYSFRNSVFLSSNVRILGSGGDSILMKSASHSTAVDDDSDWYDQEVTLKAGHGFQVGDGICLQFKNPHTGSPTILKRTLIARNGNRFKLDRALRDNVWLSTKPTASALFPLLTSENTSRVVVENIALDGNRKNSAHLDGNYGGNIWIQDCSDYVFRKVITRHSNGDGISFQISHDVLVEDCHSHDNADLGLHPGSGSQRPLIRRNKLERNGIGLFWCWGVRYGLAEHNTIDDNRDYGVSIGHCDTDNVMRHNVVRRSGKVGLLFRDDGRGRDFAPNRNLVEQNQIIDNGPPDGVAVDIQGVTKDVVLRRNVIRESRQAMRRTGIRIGKDVRKLTIEENTIQGFSVPLSDLRPA